VQLSDMKKTPIFGLAGLYLVLSSIVPSYAFAQTSKKSEYQQSLDQIGREISKLSENLNANKALLKNQNDTLAVLEQKIESISRQQRVSSKNIEHYLKNISALDQQERQLDAHHSVSRKALSSLIKSRFVSGKPNFLKMVLNQQNAYAVGRLNNYYDYFSKAQQIKLTEIQREIQEIKALRLDKQTEIKKLEIELAKNDEQSKALIEASKLRKQSITNLNKKLSTSSQKIAKLEKDRTRLNSLIRQIAIQAKKLKKLEEQRRQAEQKRIKQGLPSSGESVVRPLVKGGFIKQKGRLRYPVKASLKYSFGDRIVESGMRAQGLFFQTGDSVEVKSIFRGRVLFADYLKGYGVLLIIDHGDEHISLYGHNEVIYKNVGDMVETNEVISKSGISGGLKTAGLYFEIRKNTSPINPREWLQ